jgi:acyl-CoA synthetase (AMP-forming)/AMP-acid ligase II
MTATTPATDAAQVGLERARRLVLPEFLSNNARLYPDRTALAFEDKTLTFAQLEERANRLANALAERGVRRGDNVAVLMYNCLEVVESWFGCQKLGACPVPINFRLAQAEVDYILDNANAVGIIADAELAERAAAAASQLDSVRFHLGVGEAPASAESYEAVLAAASSAVPDTLVDDEDLAFLMYTSGTTGRPKGAMLTHQNLWQHTLNWIHELNVTGDDAFLTGLPLFHIGGVNAVLPFLYLGGKAISLPSGGFDAGQAIEALIHNEATMCYFVPTQWLEICNHPKLESYDRSRLRTAAWGASQAPQSTLELLTDTFPNSEIVNAFGQTEMSSVTCMLMGREDSVNKMGSVGKPVINVRVRVVDDDMNDVPVGEIGEIVYRGPTVMKGYYRNEEATTEAFAGGWFHSGDLVRADEDGYLYVVDRKKDMIISGGENIYPAEVEAVIGVHEAVAEVAVIGVPHPRWVETPVAIVVPKEGAQVSEEEIIELCRSQLASYKKPSAVVVADQLPRNAAGKVLKRNLREEQGDRFGSGAGS